MIEYTARRISERISKAADNNVSVDVMAYALGFYLNFFGVVILTGLSGWALGCFKASMIAMMTFGVLRICSGGFHLKSLTACTVASASLFCLIPFFQLSSSITVIITCISALTVAIASPSFRHLRNMKGRKKMFYRTISTIFVLCNLLFVSAPFALACLAQSLTLIQLRKGGEQV